MRWFGSVGLALALVLGCLTGSASVAGSCVLRATSSTSSNYSPTFTGNGLLGVRVPVAGEAYAGGTVPAQSELAGFYAKPTHPATPSDGVQQRANIPTWSTLLFGDGTDTYPSGSVTGWRQSIDLHTGIVTTSGLWQGADGHSASFSYQVFTDRADEHDGLVSLSLYRTGVARPR